MVLVMGEKCLEGGGGTLLGARRMRANLVPILVVEVEAILECL